MTRDPSGGSGPGSVLRARDVAFSYDSGAPVLNDVQCDIAAGTCTAIMGSSGSGKSTLLQLLAGILVPTRGHVEFEGAPFSGLSESRRDSIRLRSFGFVFQFGELLPELTLGENVELPLLFMGVKRAQAQASASSALSNVGILEQQDRTLHQVSGGQQQRAAVARALVHKPSLVLADEPTGSLDESTADQVLGLLVASSRAQHTAVVVVTHSTAVAQRCDRILALERGSLVGQESYA